MSFDWSTFTAAIITGLSTIIAILIAWYLSKRSLYNYQQVQELKTLEERLVKSILDVRAKLDEAVMYFQFHELESIYLKTETKNLPFYVKSAKESFLKLHFFSTAFDIILEQIKTQIGFTQKTHDSYDKEMLIAFGALTLFLGTTPEEYNKEWLHSLNSYVREIDVILKRLIKLVHSKISAKKNKLGFSK